MLNNRNAEIEWTIIYRQLFTIVLFCITLVCPEKRMGCRSVVRAIDNKQNILVDDEFRAIDQSKPNKVNHLRFIYLSHSCLPWSRWGSGTCRPRIYRDRCNRQLRTRSTWSYTQHPSSRLRTDSFLVSSGRDHRIGPDIRLNDKTINQYINR